MSHRRDCLPPQHAPPPPTHPHPLFCFLIRYGITDLAGQSLECGAAGTPARLACVDFALASMFGNGVLPNTMGPYLVHPSDADATAILSTFAAWNAFYDAHRGALAGWASLHLGRPTSRSVEATAHLSSGGGGGSEVALLALFNPAGAARQGSVGVSLYYAGLAPGAGVGVARVAPGAPNSWVRNATVGGDGAVGGGAFEVVVEYALPPRSYALFTLEALA